MYRISSLCVVLLLLIFSWRGVFLQGAKKTANTPITKTVNVYKRLGIKQ